MEMASIILSLYPVLYRYPAYSLHFLAADPGTVHEVSVRERTMGKTGHHR
jgi:hypothetical protein